MQANTLPLLFIAGLFVFLRADPSLVRLCARRSNSSWQQLEVDANGLAMANYSTRGGLFKRRLLAKDVSWQPSRGRPKELGFHMTSKARAAAAQPPAWLPYGIWQIRCPSSPSLPSPRPCEC